ncbi:palmitoyltransferase ZDHHC23 [Aplysia californica]|uniref:Palmitoyltransferase n=1 Tax=Aplysia californica TaxID=6500 RepID=A0ABM0JLX4_APLCA|nr:palmitoyltransferase ZDHHC23 [Aplysia californica]
MRKGGAFSQAAGESLCCCEYENMKGERSHVLAACCDCEALDDTFDKIFKCENIPQSTIDRLFDTVADRLRLPSCLGHGAVKLKLDVAIPVVMVPTCLCLATLHPVMTVLVFLFMPLFLGGFHALWRRKSRDKRTSLFYVWGCTSVISSYVVFQCFVVAFREVLLWEILSVFTMMMLMFYFLYRAKKDPDQLFVSARTRPSHKRTPSNLMAGSASQPLYDQISGEKLDSGHSLYTDLTGVTVQGEMGAEQVTQHQRSNLRPIVGELPARAGYCPVCESYIAVRDHHCIWINSCVGGSNHRSFLLAMITFILTSLYGSHLTLTTVCTPKMYYDWFLLPNDCRWLYLDFLTAICFVTAIYALAAAIFMSVCLLFQVVLISQNVTSHELAQARRQGQTLCGVFSRDNPNNRGFFSNWLEFWMQESRRGSPKVVA